ncbi:hypothetical protein P0D87_12415 [Paraburkholderia sp. RL17-368-BIF-A]|jgi:hypothetical protein|uniref:hypothetical protein n=1 Tax=Paraburkholderia TaxID=1822464 RepID=UPI0006B3ECF4|nr:hypothetical protein AC233_31635 [Burkholderia sp. HB1]
MRQSLLGPLLLTVAIASYGGSDATSRTGPRESNDDRALTLYDSRGARVGQIASYGFVDGVVLAINGARVFVPVERVRTSAVPDDFSGLSVRYSASQLVWGSASGLYFAESNCAGASYISVYDGLYNFYAPTRPSIPVRSGSIVTLYVTSDGASASVSVASFFSTLFNRCESFQPQSIDAWKSESTFDLTGHHPEPLDAHF